MPYSFDRFFSYCFPEWASHICKSCLIQPYTLTKTEFTDNTDNINERGDVFSSDFFLPLQFFGGLKSLIPLSHYRFRNKRYLDTFSVL